MNAKESPSASTSFSVPSLLQHLFFFSVLVLFFLLQRPLFFSPALTFFFSFDVLPFFQPKILFQPKTFFSPRYFFNPKISPCLWFSASFFSSFSTHLLLFFLFSASFLSFNVLPFSPSLVQPSIFQPKTMLSPKPKTVCFKSPNVLLLLVQPLFSFVRASFSIPCQLLRP